MAVKIRLKKFGRKKKPFFRVVVMNQSSPRDGKVIEELGVYNPQVSPKVFEVEKDRVTHWLGTGAQPTETVSRLLQTEGILPKVKKSSPFHGLSKQDRKDGLTLESKAAAEKAKAEEAEKAKAEAEKAKAEEEAAKAAEAQAESTEAEEAQASEPKAEDAQEDVKAEDVQENA